MKPNTFKICHSVILMLFSKLFQPSFSTYWGEGWGANSSIFLNIWDRFDPKEFLGVVLHIKKDNTFQIFQNWIITPRTRGLKNQIPLYMSKNENHPRGLLKCSVFMHWLQRKKPKLSGKFDFLKNLKKLQEMGV